MPAITSSEWSGILDRVRREHPNLTRHWFDQLCSANLEFGILEVKCANLPQQRYLGEHCTRPFCEAAQAETGRLVSVRFTVDDGTNGASPGRDRPSPESRLFFEQEAEPPALNVEYTLDQFVTGPSNRLAHAACVAVGEAPGESYNPLFLHGSVGLGKTHLLHAVCQHALSKRHDLRVLYLSCETFTNHFIQAVEHGALHQFRFRYRHVDILLIDDIQFLSERERSQEEFFHTFNTLHEARKQIVLSADCSPREIPSLEDRLVSRFSWGLVARLDKPCLETRIAIVRKKARLRQIDLPEDVIHYIAATIDSNIRELEGAITMVDAYSQQLGHTLDLTAARVALDREPREEPGPVSIPQILEAVCEYYDVKKSDVQGKRRNRSVALPRQVCMHLARELTPYSLEEIGSFFGGRDHTTVLHAARRIAERQGEDPHLSAALSGLKSRLQNSLVSS